MKKIKKPISACSCCILEYTQSNIVGGLTISSIKNDFPDSYNSIDITFKELVNLRNVIDNILEKENK